MKWWVLSATPTSSKPWLELGVFHCLGTCYFLVQLEKAVVGCDVVVHLARPSAASWPR